MSDTRAVMSDLREALTRMAARLGGRQLRIMEVCGTHTMAISRSGLRSLMPENIVLLSGPGCPVCVTPAGYVDAALGIAQQPAVVLATFGDMIKVPGSTSSLEVAKARGAHVRVVYSPLDALALAQSRPDAQVVFLGIGFETTAPLVAASIVEARRRGLGNFSVLCAHKLVPPALRALCGAGDLAIDGFILPGHVSAIIGSAPYEFIAREFGRACVIAGFEPTDLLASMCMLVKQLVEGAPAVEIEYRRCVRPEGNPAAVEQMQRVFEVQDTVWRGLGRVSSSGLVVRPEFAAYDAAQRFGVTIPHVPEPAGCLCGDVICGRAAPTDCPLFAAACTPGHAVGPCMVSSEGSCAAHYKYERTLHREDSQ